MVMALGRIYRLARPGHVLGFERGLIDSPWADRAWVQQIESEAFSLWLFLRLLGRDTAM